MGAGDFPMVRVEIEHLRHVVQLALATHAEEMNKAVRAEVERTVNAEAFAQLVAAEVRAQLGRSVRAAVEQVMRDSVEHEVKEHLRGRVADIVGHVLKGKR